MTSLESPAWFRRHFNDDYRTIYSGRDQAQADLEAEFAVRCLAVTPGETVLDLCCGFGRHLQAFLRLGINAIGVDLSEALLRQAPTSERTALIRADMRRLPFTGGDHGFPVLVNFFTSFGYFDSDDENAAAAREMSRVLRPGGRFLLDLMNAEPTVRNLEPRTERRAGPFHLIEERRFAADTRRIEKSIQLHDTCTDERRSYVESVRVYSHDEIGALIEPVGLRVKEVFGDFSGSPLTPESPRMIITGERA